jgi:hypothetical protein
MEQNPTCIGTYITHLMRCMEYGLENCVGLGVESWHDSWLSMRIGPVG